jgi:hypothetical protein
MASPAIYVKALMRGEQKSSAEAAISLSAGRRYLDMNIEELVSGQGDTTSIEVDGISIPLRTLKNFMEKGYVHLKPERQSKSVTFWGKTCCACFTEEQLQEKA